jgi:hypothetical protein
MTTYVGMLTPQTIHDRGGIRVEYRCRLTADTTEELFTLASKLGLRKAGATHHPATDRWSYSLSPGNRARAIRFGAAER